MTLKKNPPYRKFGGTKADGVRNAKIRDVHNQLHEREQELVASRARIEQLQLELRCFDRVPVKALGKVMNIPTREAIKLDLVDPIREIHQWVDRYAMAVLATDMREPGEVSRG